MKDMKKVAQQRWYNYFKKQGYSEEDILKYLLRGYRKCEICGGWTNNKNGHHYLHPHCIEEFKLIRNNNKRFKLLSGSEELKNQIINGIVNCKICGNKFKLKDNKIKYKTTKTFICSDDCLKQYYKQRSPLSKEYWIKKGYSEIEANKLISEEQQKRGTIHAQQIKGLPIDRTKSPLCIEYYLIQGYDEDESEKLRLEYCKKVNSKEHYIEKYGEEKGQEKYNKLHKQLRNNFNKQYYIEKYGEEKGIEMWSKKYQYSQGSSKISNKLFKEIVNKLNINIPIYCRNISKKEYGKYLKNGVYVFYDFVIPELKICIEYNGDYWHCNPNKYDASYYHKQRKMLAKDIWEYDKVKKDVMLKEGYDYYIIWDTDLGRIKQIPNKIIEQYVNLILEKWRNYNDENSKID